MAAANSGIFSVQSNFSGVSVFYSSKVRMVLVGTVTNFTCCFGTCAKVI